jgi:hypothetical protein
MDKGTDQLVLFEQRLTLEFLSRHYLVSIRTKKTAGQSSDISSIVVSVQSHIKALFPFLLIGGAEFY